MTRDGIRAVALAAIMVLSVVAMGAAFAGSAAAQSNGSIVVNDDGGDADYTTIQAAIDNAEPGDTIVVQDGMYDRFSRVQIDNLTITAADGASPTISVSSDEIPDSGRIVDISGKDVEFSDINIEGPERGVGVGIRLGSVADTSGSEISGVSVTNVLTGIQTGESAADAQLVNNDISNAVVGISLRGDSATVSGNELTDIQGNEDFSGEAIGVIGTNHTFEENTISTADGVVDVRFYNENVPTVNGDDSGEELSVANTVLDVSGISSVEFFNSEALYDGSITIEDTSYATISDASQAAEVDETIELAPGPTMRAVSRSTPEDLTLKGPNAGTAGDADGRGDEATVNAQVVISADGVVFDGLEVSPPNATTNYNSEALLVNGTADDVVIRNNVVRNFGEDGIPENEGVDGINIFGGDAGDAVSNVTVSGNLVEEISGRSTAGGVAGVSVQGNVEGADVSDNTMRDIGQKETTWAFGVVVRGTGNHDETPTEVSVVDNDVSSVLSNPESATSGVGLELESGDATDVTFEGNNLNDTEFLFEDKTATVNLTDFADNNTLDRGALVEGVNIDGGTRNIVFNSIQDAEGVAPTDDTVTVLPGTYNESVTINTEGLTIEGPNAGIAPNSDNRSEEATVSGGVSVSASDVRLSGLEVRNPGQQGEADPTNYAGAVGVTVNTNSENVQIDHNVITEIGTNDDDANAIGVLANDGTSGLVVDDNELSSLEGTDEDEGAVQAILVDESGTQIADAAVTNNTITGLLDTRSTVAVRFNGDVTGENSNNDISDLNTEGNDERRIPGGFTQVISLAEGGASETGPSDVSVTENTISEIETTTEANYAPPYGVVVGSSTDVSSVTLQKNDLSIDEETGERTRSAVAIASGNMTATLDATFNYFGDDTPTVQGDITYDPFLTVEPDGLNASSLNETKQFGHDLVVPADGTPHSVAFPAPVNGTVAEVFGEFNGSIYAYDGDGWESGEAIADRNVGALDAFTVKVDEGEDDLRIAFEYMDSDAQFPTSTDLETGWNFVGAPESGTSDNAFDVTTTNIQTVSHINAGAGSQPYGVTSTAPFATNPASVSPFQGYWVFVSEDGELAATVPVGPTQSNEEGALAGN